MFTLEEMDNMYNRLGKHIAMLEGKPQLCETPFDWDENGELSPNHFDDASVTAGRF